ncbi:MAG: 3'-5' exonuclease [Phycisphaerales bacterium]|nr:MAG: 3'-5' exonuclease [Phycisphaerales bacterium]
MRSVQSYLVFDFETSGLDRSADRIIQVGLCTVSEGEVVDRRGWLVKQDVRIDPEAMARHRITARDLQARGIPPQESLANLLQAMRAAPTCMGHNTHQFDIPFMLAESRRLGMEPPDCTDFIDTAALFKGWKLGLSKRDNESFKVYADRVLSRRVTGLKYSIPACLKELRIKPGPGQLHDASQDAYLTHLIFHALQRVL